MSTTSTSRDSLRRSLRRTGAIARKELLHIVRDSRSLIAALALPLMMLLLFGFALSLDVDHIPMVVYDLDRSPQSRALIQDFRASRFLVGVHAMQGSESHLSWLESESIHIIREVVAEVDGRCPVRKRIGCKLQCLCRQLMGRQRRLRRPVAADLLERHASPGVAEHRLRRHAEDVGVATLERFGVEPVLAGLDAVDVDPIDVAGGR